MLKNCFFTSSSNKEPLITNTTQLRTVLYLKVGKKRNKRCFKRQKREEKLEEKYLNSYLNTVVIIEKWLISLQNLWPKSSLAISQKEKTKRSLTRKFYSLSSSTDLKVLLASHYSRNSRSMKLIGSSFNPNLRMLSIFRMRISGLYTRC